jgi:type VI secretion system protein ImpI
MARAAAAPEHHARRARDVMFSLKIVKGAEAAGEGAALRRLPAAPARLSIGRDPQLDWPLPDRTLALSARHCEIVVASHGVLLRDLSTNGTFVNGSSARMMHDHLLTPGDYFDVGPYRIAVEPDEGPGDVPIAAARSTPRARGGDPAAALVNGSRAPSAPAAPVAGAASADAPLTRIEPPPREPKPAAAETKPAVEAKPVDPAPAPAPSADPQPLQAIALAAITALRRLLEQEARARRRLGSRQAALREANPLRLSRTPEEALQRLLAGGAAGVQALRHAGEELAGHHERLLVSFAGAARRLGDDLQPAALETALGTLGAPAGSSERKAQLWDLYGSLWQSLGLAEDDPWSRGLIDAAMLHLSAAYDEAADEGV